jgi:superfamily II DNA/RNA helicase
VGRTGRF